MRCPPRRAWSARRRPQARPSAPRRSGSGPRSERRTCGSGRAASAIRAPARCRTTARTAPRTAGSASPATRAIRARQPVRDHVQERADDRAENGCDCDWHVATSLIGRWGAVPDPACLQPDDGATRQTGRTRRPAPSNVQQLPFAYQVPPEGQPPGSPPPEPAWHVRATVPSGFGDRERVTRRVRGRCHRVPGRSVRRDGAERRGAVSGRPASVRFSPAWPCRSSCSRRCCRSPRLRRRLRGPDLRLRRRVIRLAASGSGTTGSRSRRGCR